jgi:hypothetical protein
MVVSSIQVSATKLLLRKEVPRTVHPSEFVILVVKGDIRTSLPTPRSSWMHLADFLVLLYSFLQIVHNRTAVDLAKLDTRSRNGEQKTLRICWNRQIVRQRDCC